jgi:hypothetical protein
MNITMKCHNEIHSMICYYYLNNSFILFQFQNSFFFQIPCLILSEYDLICKLIECDVNYEGQGFFFFARYHQCLTWTIAKHTFYTFFTFYSWLWYYLAFSQFKNILYYGPLSYFCISLQQLKSYMVPFITSNEVYNFNET